jgi:hypothetical protein
LLPAFVLFAAALAVRLVWAFLVPGTMLYNIDEMECLHSGLGLILGQTPTALQWPAVPTLLLIELLALARFTWGDPAVLMKMLHGDLGGVLASLSVFLGTTFRDPLPLLVSGRVAMAFLGAFTAPTAYLLLARRFGERFGGMVGWLVALSPLLVRETAILKGDAIALLCWVAGMCLILNWWLDSRNGDRPSPMPWAGSFLVGLAAASRFTYGVFFPFLLVLVGLLNVGRTPVSIRQTLRSTFRATGAFLTGVLIFVPWLWTHPLTTAKSLAGNLVYLGRFASSRDGVFMPGFMHMLGPVALILVATGLWVMVARRRWKECIFMGGFFLAVVVPLAAARYVEERYLLPLLPILAFIAAGGAEWIIERAESCGCGRRAAAMIFALVIVINAALAVPWRKPEGAYPGMQSVRQLLHENSTAGTIAVPYQARFLVPPDSNALRRIVAAYDCADGLGSADRRAAGLGRSVGGKMTGAGLPAGVVEAVFGEDEAMDRVRYGLMLGVASATGGGPDPARDVIYHQKNADKPDSITTDTAREMFLRGDIRGIVLPGRYSWGGTVPPLKRITRGEWCLYLR